MTLHRAPKEPPRPGEIVRLGVVALLFLAAPVAGDIGSCNESAGALDPTKFFEAKQATDCQRCMECGLHTNPCTAACGKSLLEDAFPTNCVPLVHDGEVCLDALLAASCSDYEGYVADQGATTPTECDFCPLSSAPDGGAP